MKLTILHFDDDNGASGLQSLLEGMVAKGLAYAVRQQKQQPTQEQQPTQYPPAFPRWYPGVRDIDGVSWFCQSGGTTRNLAIAMYFTDAESAVKFLDTQPGAELWRQESAAHSLVPNVNHGGETPIAPEVPETPAEDPLTNAFPRWFVAQRPAHGSMLYWYYQYEEAGTIVRTRVQSHAMRFFLLSAAQLKRDQCSKAVKSVDNEMDHYPWHVYRQDSPNALLVLEEGDA